MTFVPLLHYGYIFPSQPLLQLPGFSTGATVDYFSPQAVCLSSSSTMKTSVGEACTEVQASFLQVLWHKCMVQRIRVCSFQDSGIIVRRVDRLWRVKGGRWVQETWVLIYIKLYLLCTYEENIFDFHMIIIIFSKYKFWHSFSFISHCNYQHLVS